MTSPRSLAAAPASIAAIVPAAGSGRRFGASRNKLFAELCGKSLWLHALERLASQPEIGRKIMVVSEEDHDRFADEFADALGRYEIELARGGKDRSDSVMAGLETLSGDDAVQFVAVHDAARPLVTGADLQAVFAAAVLHGAALLATPVVGTLKRSYEDQRRCETVDRRDLWTALTPQVFRVDWLRHAYRRHHGWPVTDDAQLVERSGYPVAIVRGRADNLKITHPEDLPIAEALLARQNEHGES